MTPIPKERALVVISKEILKKSDIKAKFYPKLELLIRTLGDGGVNILQLSRQFGLPKSTLHDWKEDILDNLSITDIKRLMLDLKITSIANLKTCQKLIRSTSDERIQLGAMKIHSEMSKNFMDLLDRMGVTATETKEKTLAQAYLEYEREKESERG